MELTIDIERDSAVPIYAQLSEQIRLLVRRGKLVPGDSMPTVRSLAVDLGVNANTVARVYRDLQQEGLLRLERGIGTFVANGDARAPVREEDFRSLQNAAGDLVELARTAGLRIGELTRLIENSWRETHNAER